jgi:hypothetical protein
VFAAFSLHRESSDLDPGRRPLVFEVVFSTPVGGGGGLGGWLRGQASDWEDIKDPLGDGQLDRAGGRLRSSGYRGGW